MEIFTRAKKESATPARRLHTAPRRENRIEDILAYYMQKEIDDVFTGGLLV
ncbi:MAG: hypothetical protein LBC99_06550 [Spirochaetota bacterium]|jgi:hypothetical protein|nr:hypothetical protein [Spirochaetota bacterium]